MPTFITRVELHRADPADYELLHIEMTLRKFSRSVTSAEGKVFGLPTGMYHSFGEIAVSQVRDLAQDAAARIGRNAWVFSAEYTGAAWSLHEIAR